MISVPSFPNHGFAVFPAYTRGPLLSPLLPSPSGSLLSQSKVQSRPLSPADPSEAPWLDAPASPAQPDLAGRSRVSFRTCLTPRPAWPCAHPYIYFSMPLTVFPLPWSHLLLHLILKLYHPERFYFYLPRIPKQVLSVFQVCKVHSLFFSHSGFYIGSAYFCYLCCELEVLKDRHGFAIFAPTRALHSAFPTWRCSRYCSIGNWVALNGSVEFILEVFFFFILMLTSHSKLSLVLCGYRPNKNT